MKKTYENTKNNSGITLVALVITIIVLLILAGITINLTLGENGLLNRAEGAKGEHTKGSIKEELEMDIANMYIEKKSKGETLTKQEIAEELSKKTEILDVSDTEIQGEYKDYNYIVDENNKVIVGEELKGAKPTGEIIILTQGNAEEVEIQVIATTTEGEISSLESMDGLIAKTENSNSDKIYTVIKNGEYRFKIKGTNGRVATIKGKVNNVIELAESIIEAIGKIDDSGERSVRVKGKTSGSDTEEKVTYSLNVVRHKGDLVLDGENAVAGVTPTENKVYEFGNVNDVGTQSANAKNTVVLKVEGNLTINEGVKLTTVKSSEGYGGPKGLIIYCSGKVINNGEISMTARGAKAEGQNVYLWKNNNDTWEYVPAVGAGGGASVNTEGHDYGASSWYWKLGKNGNDGILRQTGGGGSGAASASAGYSEHESSGLAYSGNGSNGTSYSGGVGGRRLWCRCK